MKETLKKKKRKKSSLWHYKDAQMVSSWFVSFESWMHTINKLWNLRNGFKHYSQVVCLFERTHYLSKPNIHACFIIPECMCTINTYFWFWSFSPAFLQSSNYRLGMTLLALTTFMKWHLYLQSAWVRLEKIPREKSVLTSGVEWQAVTKTVGKAKPGSKRKTLNSSFGHAQWDGADRWGHSAIAASLQLCTGRVELLSEGHHSFPLF